VILDKSGFSECDMLAMRDAMTEVVSSLIYQENPIIVWRIIE